MGGRVEIGFELGITCSDTMINYQLFRKLKLLGNDDFNHLTIILIVCMEFVPKWFTGMYWYWNVFAPINKLKWLPKRYLWLWLEYPLFDFVVSWTICILFSFLLISLGIRKWNKKKEVKDTPPVPKWILLSILDVQK